MTYGIKIRPYNDPYIKMVEEAMVAIAELLIPGAFLVDIIPILKYVPEWFPGAKFQRKAAISKMWEPIYVFIMEYKQTKFYILLIRS